jgi:hypothetical protein
VAQSDTTITDTISKGKKPLMLSFGLDIKMKSIAGSYNHDYTGEYNIYGAGPGGWEWVNHRVTDKDLLNRYSYFSQLKISVLGGISKSFKIGLCYNFGYVSATINEPNFDSLNNPGVKTNNVEHTISYAGIGVMGEYNYYFNKKTMLGPYLTGSVDLGFYTGTDDIFGPGTPWFIQGKLGVGYNFKSDIMVKAYIATDQLHYHETSQSQVYQKSQSLNIDLSTFYLGIGFVKMFTIFPD